MKKAIWVGLLLFAPFLFPVQWVNAQDPGRSWHDLVRNSLTSLSGLEAPDFRKVRVVVNFKETGSPFGEAFKERIRRSCDLRLRQAGLDPVAEKNTGEYLRVNFGILSRTMVIDLDFMRFVVFSVGKKLYSAEASTWEAGTFGTHGNKEESVVNSLDGRLDFFSKEYLKANLKEEK